MYGLLLWILLLGVASHVLVECANLQNNHEKYFMVSFLKELFESINYRTIINFIQETHFYNQLYCLLFRLYISCYPA